jgi:hypothetical protein
LILLLDEPEVHLHPSVLIDVVGRLRAANPNGQVWIATHDVPLLAAVPTESIWYLNDGEVSWAGRNPEIVLNGLLGGPGGRERVEAFLSLPAQFASHRFAAECLTAPASVPTGPDDPQAEQVRKFCEILDGDSGQTLKILDFGAGQGRLLSAMSERWTSKVPFRDKVDYRAFELPNDELATLQGTVEAVYGRQPSPKRIFVGTDELTMLDAASVDIVLMCNVLHEVPPEEWVSLFDPKGHITRVIKSTGHLLILEDMEIPHGEKAHRFGFLILDRPHLFQLFSCSEEDDNKVRTFDVRDGRLKMHVVDGRLLGRTTKQSARRCLEVLKDSSLTNISKIRSLAPDSRSGREHALWTQTLANVELALRIP